MGGSDRPQCNHGQNVFHCAAQNDGLIEVIRILTRRRGKVDIGELVGKADKKWDTPLSLSIRSGKVSMFKTLEQYCHTG